MTRGKARDLAGIRGVLAVGTRANIEGLVSTPSVHLAVLVVATDPAKADLGTAMIVRGRANGAGHQIVQQTVTKDAEANIRSALARWIDDSNIDVILVIGAVESDSVPAALKPLVTQKLEGFTDLFRYLAFQEMGAGAMLSHAEAAQCSTTFVFVLPGGHGAVGTAMDKLIIPQLDRQTQPKNLVSQMPRIRNAPGPGAGRDAVPATIAPEKTTGGFGLAPKLPARVKPPTGKNVIRRPQDDPPTKQIELAKLERQLELSHRSPNDAQTKPAIDLRKLLPKVPPGADETLETEAAPHDDTDAELLAAPPPLLGTARIDTSPPIAPPKPLPSVLPTIKGNAFDAKASTSPKLSSTPAKGAVARPMPSLGGITGNAFDAKEKTEPGAVNPTRAKAPSGQARTRPISVPPTNAFGGKEGTIPGATNPPASAFATKKESGTSPGQAPPTAARPPASTAVAAQSSPSAQSSSSAPSAQSTQSSSSASLAAQSSSRSAPVAAHPSSSAQSSSSASLAAQSSSRSAPVAAHPSSSAQSSPSASVAAQSSSRSAPVAAHPSSSAQSSPSASVAAQSSSRSAPVASHSSSSAPVAAQSSSSASVATQAKEPSHPISSGMIGLPSSKIFAAAAQQPAEPPAGEPSKANGASRPSSQSLTPSVEMAPLIEATLEDELDEEVAEPVTVPRKRAPTPPPPPVVAKEPAKDSPPSRKWEPTQKVDPMPITPAMRSSGELPVGTFMYPSARRSSGLLKWLLLLFALGAGFGAVVFVAPRLMKQDDGTKQATQVAQTTPPPAPPAPPVPPADQPVPESPSTPSAEQAAPPPTTETNSPASDTNPTTTTTPTTTPPTPPMTTRSTHSRSTSKQTTKVTAKTSPTASGPTQPTDTNPSPPSDTKPAEPKGDPTCDEVSCVLSKYDRPCCERYKPKETAIAKRSGSVPEELDRAAVRASIDKVKPAVVACGEKAGVKGTVKIAVAVAPEGNVTSADVAESPDAALGSCVASAIKRAKFTKTINGGSFTYPFVF